MNRTEYAMSEEEATNPTSDLSATQPTRSPATDGSETTHASTLQPRRNPEEDLAATRPTETPVTDRRKRPSGFTPPKNLEENPVYKKTRRVMEDRLRLPTESIEENAAGVTFIRLRSPWINTERYPFFNDSKGTGVDYRALILDSDGREYNARGVKSSLMYALDPVCQRYDPNCLDLVFRQALKQISAGLQDLEDETQYSFKQRPFFLSAKYLELTLLRRIQEHYERTLQLNFCRFIVSAVREETSQLALLCEGNNCEHYLRKLVDFYGLGLSGGLEEATREPMATPKAMRVWTDVESQSVVNGIFTEFANATYRATVDVSETLDPVLVRSFAEEYAKGVDRLMSHQGLFIAEVLKRSELFAWCCFGITIDHPAGGSRAMAVSFIQLDKQVKKNRKPPHGVELPSGQFGGQARVPVVSYL